MIKKPHPCDQFDAGLIARAHSFTVSIFQGRGVYETKIFKALEAARRHRDGLRNPDRQRAMIHAITTQGPNREVSTFVE